MTQAVSPEAKDRAEVRDPCRRLGEPKQRQSELRVHGVYFYQTSLGVFMGTKYSGPVRLAFCYNAPGRIVIPRT